MAPKVDLKKVDQYYSGKLQQHGATPQGVDWNGNEGQTLRFQQLAKLMPVGTGFSLLDYGCGYGAMCEFLQFAGLKCDYTGYDISAAMISSAKGTHPKAKWVSTLPKHRFDYAVASGLFNVKLDHSPKAWKEYIFETIHQLHQFGERGFAYNLLTSYSDEDKQRPDLYYADPNEHFDYAKRHLSKDVALLHDYGLYEFTIIVRGKK